MQLCIAIIVQVSVSSHVSPPMYRPYSLRIGIGHVSACIVLYRAILYRQAAQGIGIGHVSCVYRAVSGNSVSSSSPRYRYQTCIGVYRAVSGNSVSSSSPRYRYRTCISMYRAVFGNSVSSCSLRYRRYRIRIGIGNATYLHSTYRYF